MKNWCYFIGVDVSKNTLDLYCSVGRSHITIENGKQGFKTFLKWCKGLHIDLSKALVTMEHTGGYEHKFVYFCTQRNIDFVRLPGLEIKRSLGITRGKNDRVDAMRIAQYAEEKQKHLEPSKPLNSKILYLRELLNLRKRLVRTRASYKSTIKERMHQHDLPKKDFIVHQLSHLIEVESKAIRKVEEEIMQLINSDEQFRKNYDLLTSIKGIGKVNAWMTIAYTENFTSFQDGRTYAVYAGVVPFDHSSGTSIRGRSRVSQLANKEVKQELSQAARTAVQFDRELKEYAVRKLAEGKAWGVVMNNIKFKLVLRMFAVVKRGTNYVDKYQFAA